MREGTDGLWQGLPVLIVLLAGGFSSNLIWVVILHARNRSTGEYWTATIAERGRTTGEIESGALGGPAVAIATHPVTSAVETRSAVPLLRNYLLCALAGVTWYLQFFFYTMGDTKMGPLTFSSWSIHMASIVVFSTLWGIGLKEWKGASTTSIRLLAAGLAILLGSTLVVGYGNYLATVQ